MMEWLNVGRGRVLCPLAALASVALAWHAAAQQRDPAPLIGQEFAVARHLQDGEEFTLSPLALVEHGKKLFIANWTDQDGGGRPLSKGTGATLSDRTQPLTGPRAFSRVSGPDANSCQGCHNVPYAIAGGGGDVTTNVFEMAQRFDFVTFDRKNARVTGGSVDEARRPVSLRTVGNLRSTPGLFGAGYVELLARQITADLQHIRDSIQPGRSKPLASKGISFGTLARRADGSWNSQRVSGLPPQSLLAPTPAGTPSLVIRPWHQSGTAVSLREITNTSFNQHHGIQTTERFGVNTDPDEDGVKNEMTRADVTAVAVFEATLPAPGRVIPNDPEVERAVSDGERVFDEIHCTTCHVPGLPLEKSGWGYSEPGPYNPPGNLRRTGSRVLTVDLTDPTLPQPRLTSSPDDPTVVHVPAYTDFKLHDITDPADEEAAEPLDMNQRAGSVKFLAGNRRFLTRRLWGAASQPTHFHHGLFTTLRQAVLAHAGEALDQRRAFERLPQGGQDALIEFLKSLQVLPAGSRSVFVDEKFQPRAWPPARR